MQQQALTERLITYDTSTSEGLRSAAGFVKGWLEARDIEVHELLHGDVPVLTASVGAAEGPTILLHGHLDVVPGFPAQFEPRVEGDRLYGRGAYDMKGGLAGMMCATRDLAEQSAIRVDFLCVPDEEGEDDSSKSTDRLVAGGCTGDFAITGEPTDLRIGVQAKGVLMMSLEVCGTAAHGARPWLGDNAVLKAIDVFRRIESMPFARESSELFDRPSINLGRISGGDAVNKVPDTCVIDVDVRFLPGQDPEEILVAVEEIPDVIVRKTFRRRPAVVDASNPFVRTLATAVADGLPTERISVGRDGASDAISFLDAGVPAVEFGPTGGGHHGPQEWVSIASLARYRFALVEFVDLLAGRRDQHLRIA